jgi:hypothetical protein
MRDLTEAQVKRLIARLCDAVQMEIFVLEIARNHKAFVTLAPGWKFDAPTIMARVIAASPETFREEFQGRATLKLRRDEFGLTGEFTVPFDLRVRFIDHNEGTKT